MTLEELQKQLVEMQEKADSLNKSNQELTSNLEATRKALEEARTLNQSLTTKLLARVENPVQKASSEPLSIETTALKWYDKK